MSGWFLRAIPSGAAWRYSRFSALRLLGNWWLPRWGGIAWDAEYDEDEDACRFCDGTGSDHTCDGLLPCPICGGGA